MRDIETMANSMRHPSRSRGFRTAAVLLVGCSAARAAMPELNLDAPHTIVDQGYNLTWATLTLPKGWGYNGGMIHANNCQVVGPSPLYSGESPDHRFGFVVLPSLKSSWSSDEATNARMRAAGCPISNSSSAEGFLRAIVMPRVAPPGAHFDEAGPAAEFAGVMQQIKDLNQRLQANAPVMPNFRTNYVVDSAKLKFSFDKGGKHMRGTMVAVTSCADQTMLLPNGSVHFYDCTALVLAASYAPAEDMDAFDKSAAFKVDINPAWTERNIRSNSSSISNDSSN